MSGNNIVTSGSNYQYESAVPSEANDLLTPHILNLCRQLKAKRVLDVGCGNGSVLVALHQAGFQVAGCDPSESGLAFAQQKLPDANLKVLGIYDDPAQMQEADFDVVISMEVVEHLFYPRHLPRFAKPLLKPGGHLIVTTPYHGYLKNLALSLTNHWDTHHTVFWDGGHIKFWSKSTLSRLLREEGFVIEKFVGAGRVPLLWKGMILVARKPE